MLYRQISFWLMILVSYHAVRGSFSGRPGTPALLIWGDAPVGMKNQHHKNLRVMFNAIYAAQNKQTFLYHGQKWKLQNPLLCYPIVVP